MIRLRTTTALGVATALVALSLTACGSDDSDCDSAPATGRSAPVLEAAAFAKPAPPKSKGSATSPKTSKPKSGKTSKPKTRKHRDFDDDCDDD